MKKKLLLFLLNLFTYNLLISQKIYVPDDNFEQALITLGYDNGPLDDSVFTVNIDTITSLNVASKSISDLTGIEYFDKLEFLYCGGNNLTSLDMAGNLALIRLYCFRNNLTSISISKNIALEYLSCWKNNLTNLDVSKNIFLGGIDCANNNLPFLNLKNGYGFRMRYLNTENNPNLTCIQVDDVFFSTALWLGTRDPYTKFDTNCNYFTGIGDQSNQNIDNLIVYPNPTINFLNIEFESEGNYSLFSIDGKQVLQSGILQSNNTTINISSLTTGMYLLRVVTDEGNIITKRIIKQ
jgi:hypothetical protein